MFDLVELVERVNEYVEVEFDYTVSVVPSPAEENSVLVEVASTKDEDFQPYFESITYLGEYEGHAMVKVGDSLVMNAVPALVGEALLNV